MPGLTALLRVLRTYRKITDTQQNLLLLIWKDGWKGCRMTASEMANLPEIWREENHVRIQLRWLRDKGFIRVVDEVSINTPISHRQPGKRHLAKVTFNVYAVDVQAIADYCTHVDQQCVHTLDLMYSSYEEHIPRKPPRLRRAGCPGRSKQKPPASKQAPTVTQDPPGPCLPSSGTTAPAPTPTECRIRPNEVTKNPPMSNINSFGLANEKTTAAQTSVRELEQRPRVEKLRQALRKAGRLRPFRESKWLRAFAAAAHEHTQERLDKALDWYCSHVGQPFVPRAYCGTSFRAKFFQIEDAMKRQTEEAPVEIGKSARAMVEEVGDDFRGENRTLLPQVAQRSMDAAKKVYEKLRRVTNGHNDPAAAILGRWPDPYTMVKEWLRKFAERKCGENSSARITNYVFSPESKFADEFFGACGVGAYWTKVKLLLTEKADEDGAA